MFSEKQQFEDINFKYGSMALYHFNFNTFSERQQLEDINGYYGHQNLGADLSSYVAVVGAPTR